MEIFWRWIEEEAGTYTDAGSGVLTGLEQEGDITTHLPHDRLPLVPQQLDPRHRHLRGRLAVFFGDIVTPWLRH